MDRLKRCRQCGELKQDTLFRQYYKRSTTGQRSTSRYKICLECERINNRYKYLVKKQSLTPSEEQEVTKVELLYDLLRQRGLEPPGTRADAAPLDLDTLIERHQAELENPQELESNLPAELQRWLDADLTDLDYGYLEEVGDMLLAKYRPVVGMTSDMTPVYDERYRSTINEILRRFDEMDV